MIAATLLTFCLLNSEDSPQQAFFKVMDSYAKLDSFSADIEHDNSSGLFSGKFHQELIFKKGKGFRLVVSDIHGKDRAENVAPDYYCDNVDVTSVGRLDGTRPINKDPNTSPGYEVSGGLIMTWLLDTPMKGIFLKPQEGLSLEYRWGKRDTWKNLKVAEIVMAIKFAGREDKNEMSLFLDSDKKKLVGTEWARQGKIGTMVYKNQKDNPEIDPAKFKPPV